MARAVFSGEKVTIENVRDFAYRSVREYDAHYARRSYDLSKLDSVWFVVERFGTTPGLAHTLLSCASTN